MTQQQPKAGPLSLGRPDTSSPQYRMLQGAHETFARSLEASLSSALQAETQISIVGMSPAIAGDFHKSLRSPTCLIALKLHPRQERAVLHFDSATVFAMLELLLGGKSATQAAARELTEIEWSLLEEVVRVIVRSLGEAWRVFAEVEFEVESLGSDPEMLPCSDPTQPIVRINFDLKMGGRPGSFEIAAPQSFFDAGNPVAEQQVTASAVPSPADVDRNLSLLEDAIVELEVTLKGPTLEFQDLMQLKTGQVMTFEYPLAKPLNASVNGAVRIAGHIVSSGRKRAFLVAELP
jgi:flagellar motor switch protein FliM